MKKKVLLLLGGIILFAFIAITSMMWYQLFYGQVKNTVPVLKIRLEKAKEELYTSSSVPLDFANAASITPYVFSAINDSDKALTYKILLEEPPLSDEETFKADHLLSRSQLAYQLMMNGQLVKYGSLSEIKNNILDERNINAHTTNSYELRIYVGEQAFNSAWQNKYYHYQVIIQIEED